MRLTSVLCTTLLLLAASCGGSDVSANAALDSGYGALNGGDHTAALGHFEGALSGLPTTDANYLPAKIGQMQAMAYIDPAKAKATLLAIPSDAGVTAKDYSSLVTDLGSAAEAMAMDKDTDGANNAMAIAISILTEGQSAFPEYANWEALITKTGDRAKKLGSADALSALKGLGYAGDD
jgi:hypothetical protein